MAQASQFTSSRTIWMGFAVRAPQSASTIDDSTVSLGSRLYDVEFIDIKNIETATQRRISNRKQKVKKSSSYLVQERSQARGELAIMEIETNESTCIKGIPFCAIIINCLSNMFKLDVQYNCIMECPFMGYLHILYLSLISCISHIT